MIHKDEHYSLDSQGLIVEHVGPWAIDKLKSLPITYKPQALRVATISAPVRHT